MYKSIDVTINAAQLQASKQAFLKKVSGLELNIKFNSSLKILSSILGQNNWNSICSALEQNRTRAISPNIKGLATSLVHRKVLPHVNIKPKKLLEIIALIESGEEVLAKNEIGEKDLVVIYKWFEQVCRPLYDAAIEPFRHLIHDGILVKQSNLPSIGCHLILSVDWRDGFVGFCVRDDSEGGSFDVRNKHISEYVMPLSTDVNALISMLNSPPYFELIERVCAGYSTEFNNDNVIAIFSDDSSAALELFDSYFYVAGVEHEWKGTDWEPLSFIDQPIPICNGFIYDGFEWVGSLRMLDDVDDVIRFLGYPYMVVRENTDDKMLKEIAYEIECGAESEENSLIRGSTLSALEELRDHIAE